MEISTSIKQQHSFIQSMLYRSMPSIHDLYHSSFRTKLDLANQLFLQHGKGLLAIPSVQGTIGFLDRLALQLQQKMSALDAASFCAVCARKSGGGCCSLYMADESDTVLFMINLLAGVSVTIQKDDDFECYLLGPSGCTLLFKPIFCLNYNCLAMKNHPDTALFSSYLAISGKVLQSQWQLETIILAYLLKAERRDC